MELSDEALIAKMLEELQEKDYRFSVALVTILTSQQFRYHRGRDAGKQKDL